MKTVSLSGSLRGNVGKKDAKSLRMEDKVPCVLYGGTEQIHFALHKNAFKSLLFTPETFVIEINLDGKVYKSILKDVQYHPVGDNVLHADFYEINDVLPVVVSLPVKLLGTAPGVIRGGRLSTKLSHLKVKGLIADMPDFIELSIAKLNIGQSIRVRNVEVPNLKMLNDMNSVIVAVKAARVTAAVEDEEEEAEDKEAADETATEAPQE
ncbi:MAG: 50S ribosomal protein L25 [Bacteroidales bacterium]|jgi:large subunit ribosomal protein L25|nr:50S ribosomal protein L25 [Bacteroidales bacterium]MDD3701992.1 50S ribosomal protein L25 [Bacteroidales bacterium]MDY0368982.1 50S ribosomal protein L25 [Bacteroidales bacterium]